MEEVQEKQGFLRKWLPLTVMGLAVLIIVIDTTLLNVSLGTIIRELHTNIQSMQWVIAAYALTLAALTIVGGRLGDLFGRKKMFMLGATIFAIGSFIASASHSVGYLLAGESIIEGIGAALMMPASASLLITTYRNRERALALGLWGAMAAAGSAIGPILGGYLTTHYSWRWGFRINVGIALLLIAGSVIINESKDTRHKISLDWVGVFLSSGGLLAGVFAIIEGGSYGWWKHMSGPTFGGLSAIPLAFMLSVGLLCLFVWWEDFVLKRGRRPLVDMKIFANKQFTSGSLTLASQVIGMTGIIFAMPVFLQGVRGLDALHTGYALLPMSIALLIMAPLGGFLSGKIGTPKHIVQVGLITTLFGIIVLRYSLSISTTVSDLILPLSFYGAGMGLCFSQLTNITLSSVPVEEVGEASGLNNTIRQVASSLGAAIIGTVLLTGLANNLKSSVSTSPVLPADMRVHISQEVAAQSSAVEFGVPIHSSAQLTAEQRTEIKKLSNQSTVDANRNVFLVAMLSPLLAFVFSTQLPKDKSVKHHD